MALEEIQRRYDMSFVARLGGKPTDNGHVRHFQDSVIKLQSNDTSSGPRTAARTRYSRARGLRYVV